MYDRTFADPQCRDAAFELVLRFAAMHEEADAAWTKDLLINALSITVSNQDLGHLSRDQALECVLYE